MSAPKIGDTVWAFDGHFGRTYADGWFALPIIGETSTSWILGGVCDGWKVTKCGGMFCRRFTHGVRRKVEFSREAVDADIAQAERWLAEHRARILHEVERAGLDTLKAIDLALTASKRPRRP